VGESITRAGLARALAERLQEAGERPPGEAAGGVLRERVLAGQPRALPPAPPDCGALALRVALRGAPAAGRAAPEVASTLMQSDGGGGGCERGSGAVAAAAGSMTPADGAIEVELAAAHSARSFGCAWWAPGMGRPRCSFLRRGAGVPPAGAPLCTIGARAEWALPLAVAD
jgi:hypothetical protein